MFEGGFFDFWRKSEFLKVFLIQRKNYKSEHYIGNNINADGQQIKSLTITQLQSAFYSFVFSVCVSSLSILIEIQIFLIKNKNCSTININ